MPWPLPLEQRSLIFEFGDVLAYSGAVETQTIGRRLDIPTGQQTYRAVKVKLIVLVTNDQKKNVIEFNKDFFVSTYFELHYPLLR